MEQLSGTNRGTAVAPDRVLGSVEEITKLGLDPQLFVSCGPPTPGFARCPFARTCDHGFKGASGVRKVVAIDSELRVKKVDKEGKPVPYAPPPARGQKASAAHEAYVAATPVLDRRASCGPRNALVYRRDAFSGGSKLQWMPCYRVLENRRRWDQRPMVTTPQGPRPGQPDLVEIVAWEGDGQMWPTKETREVADKDAQGRPRSMPKVIEATEYRAVPFFERPEEFLPQLELENQVDKMRQQRRVREAQEFVEAMTDDLKPMQMGVALQALGDKGGEKAK